MVELIDKNDYTLKQIVQIAIGFIDTDIIVRLNNNGFEEYFSIISSKRNEHRFLN